MGISHGQAVFVSSHGRAVFVSMQSSVGISHGQAVFLSMQSPVSVTDPWSCLMNSQFHSLLEIKNISFCKQLARLDRHGSTCMNVKHISTKLRLWKRQTYGVIKKILLTAKLKFRFGHFQLFCDNSVGSFTWYSRTDVLCIHKTWTALL